MILHMRHAMMAHMTAWDSLLERHVYGLLYGICVDCALPSTVGVADSRERGGRRKRAIELETPAPGRHAVSPLENAPLLYTATPERSRYTIPT